MPADDVRTSLERLAAGRMLVLKLATHEIWMANPLSAVPTSFRVTTPRGSWWGNCIWDALGIPAMLDTAATIETACPDCEAPRTRHVRDGSLVAAGGVVHFSVPAAHWWDDIGHT